MNRKQDTHAPLRLPEPCVSPEVGDLLPDYIVELLSAEAAGAVKEHLEVCRHCMDDYRNILGLRAAARKLLAAGRAAREGGRRDGAAVRRLSDYKK